MATERDFERLHKTETINKNKKQQAEDRIGKNFLDYVMDFVKIAVPALVTVFPSIVDLVKIFKKPK